MHVFCEKSAGTAIKSYSPELIVHPVLSVSSSNIDLKTAVDVASQWIPRIDGVLIGPGLGRDPLIILTTTALICKAAELGLPMVLDADGLYILTSAFRNESDRSYDEMRKALRSAPLTITPNKAEFERLCAAMGLTAGVCVYVCMYVCG